jgi:uncharacterized membrane protein
MAKCKLARPHCVCGSMFLRMPLTSQPLADSRELDSVREELYHNVPSNERIGSIAAGAALIGLAIWKRSLGTMLLAAGGAALIHRGVTGHCHIYEKLGINSRQLNAETGVPGNKGIKINEEITIHRPATDIYRFWRQPENLARFMEHVKSVEEIDDLRSRWVVTGPAGTDLEWMATILTDHEDELISWESLPGAEVQNAGSVRFEPVDHDTTRVRVTLQYQPPAGVLGAAVAKWFGEAPDQQLREDLGRLKQLLETTATTSVSPNGRRESA